jgi:hypothetical protein
MRFRLALTLALAAVSAGAFAPSADARARCSATPGADPQAPAYCHGAPVAAKRAACRRRSNPWCAVGVTVSGLKRKCRTERVAVFIDAFRKREPWTVYLDGVALNEEDAILIDCSALAPGDHRLEVRCNLRRTTVLYSKRFTVAR